MTATDLTNAILLELPREFENCRAWRRNVGVAYSQHQVGAAISLLIAGNGKAALQVLRSSRPVRYGLNGEPDIDGIICVRGIGVRFGVEVKAGRDRQRDDQKVFEATVVRLGGIYIVARDLEGCIRDLRAAVQTVERRLAG